MSPEFVKKPVKVEAFPVDTVVVSYGAAWLRDIPNWIRNACKVGQIEIAGDGLNIRTLEGVMRADAGDMIIRGVKGEIYPCKPDIFEATYKALDVADEISVRITNALLPEYGWAGSVSTDDEGSVHIDMVVIAQ